VHRCVNELVGCLEVVTDADRWRLGMSLEHPLEQQRVFAPADLEVTEVRVRPPAQREPRALGDYTEKRVVKGSQKINKFLFQRKI
jgi:hypothetical protein